LSSGEIVATAADNDPEPAVSIDAVDFGANAGTIFYVPSDHGTTTVVWVSDDEAGADR
jgi:Ni,Fe-hydrogenase maturation factor